MSEHSEMSWRYPEILHDIGMKTLYYVSHVYKTSWLVN